MAAPVIAMWEADLHVWLVSSWWDGCRKQQERAQGDPGHGRGSCIHLSNPHCQTPESASDCTIPYLSRGTALEVFISMMTWPLRLSSSPLSGTSSSSRMAHLEAGQETAGNRRGD
jgi:hypothetical protein